MSVHDIRIVKFTICFSYSLDDLVPAAVKFFYCWYCFRLSGRALVQLCAFHCSATAFCFGTFATHFSATGCVFCHENIRRWTVGCYNGLYVSCFGDFEKFVCISIYCVSALSLRIESTESMTNVTSHNLCNKNKINCSPDYMKQGSHDLCVYKVQSIQLSNKTFSCSLMLETYMMQRFIVV